MMIWREEVDPLSDSENEQQEKVEAQTHTDQQDLGEAIGYLDPSKTA